MVEFILSLADAFHLRFAISPVGETVRLASAIANPTAHGKGPRAAWLRRHRPSVERLLREHDLRPLLVLVSASNRYHPDFLTPPPATPVGEIEAELSQIRATSASQIECELDRCLGDGRAVDPESRRRLRRRDTGA
jgi:hypothetical protein